MSPEETLLLKRGLMAYWRLIKSRHASEAEDAADALIEVISEIQGSEKKK